MEVVLPTNSTLDKSEVLSSSVQVGGKLLSLSVQVGAVESEVPGRSHLVEIAFTQHLPLLSSLLLKDSDVLLFLPTLDWDSA